MGNVGHGAAAVVSSKRFPLQADVRGEPAVRGAVIPRSRDQNARVALPFYVSGGI